MNLDDIAKKDSTDYKVGDTVKYIGHTEICKWIECSGSTNGLELDKIHIVKEFYREHHVYVGNGGRFVRWHMIKV